MKIYFQALIFILMAIPFLYMLYDVTRDLAGQAIRLVSRKARPIVNTLIGTYLK